MDGEVEVRGEPRQDSDQGEAPAGRAREGGSPGDDPGSKSARALTRDEIEALLDATLDNAHSTLSAAELLLEQGLLPQAYTLAHLALEEASKVTMLLGSWLGLLIGMTLDWNRFWKAWTSHDDKNQFMIFNLLFDRMRSDHVDPEAPWEPLSSSEEAAALQAMPSVFAALAEQMNMTLPQYKALQKKRLAATYVDFRDGRVADPKTVATEDEVSSFVTAARSLIDWEQLAWANRAPFQDMLPDFAKQVLVEVEKSFASPPAPPE